MLRSSPFAGALLSVGLLAAACGSDDAADQAATGEAEPAPTESANTEETDPTEQPSEEATEQPTVEATPEELSASYRGVTSDTITIGVALTDVSVFTPTGDAVPRYEALVDATNAAGGIGGRQVEVVLESWEILDSVGSEAQEG